MLETLLGGILAILGGLGATYFQLRYAKKNKMEEVVAERKIAVNAQAYSIIKEIQGSFIQSSLQETYVLISRHEQWFFDNRLFLPGEFPSLWLSIRNSLRKLARREKMSNNEDAELIELDGNIEKELKKAISEIYKDMGITDRGNF